MVKETLYFDTLTVEEILNVGLAILTITSCAKNLSKQNSFRINVFKQEQKLILH